MCKKRTEIESNGTECTAQGRNGKEMEPPERPPTFQTSFGTGNRVLKKHYIPEPEALHARKARFWQKREDYYA